MKIFKKIRFLIHFISNSFEEYFVDQSSKKTYKHFSNTYKFERY